MIDMDARLADMPILAQRDDALDAKVFNVWHRARSRWGEPIRIDDTGLKQIEIILTDRYWVCADVILHYCPVVAWVDFERENRGSLHEPIPCKINYYHFAASALRAKALEQIKEVLEQRLWADG